MTNELQTLNQRIAERIGKDLVDLIPEDQWQAIVDNEVKKFRLDVAPKIIQDLVADEFRKESVKRIEELTQTTEWNEITGRYTNEKLKEFISEGGGDVFAGVLAPAMTMLLNDLNHRLSQGMANGY